MRIDAHVHCSGQERADDVLRTFDDAGIDRAVLLAPFLSDGYALDHPESLRRGNAHLAELVRGRSDRLTGFAVLNPLSADAADDLDRAVEAGLAGLKLVPSGWYPDDERTIELLVRAASHDLPVLFHSGIFIDGRSGRFCRPVLYEAIRGVPGLRATLAHLGWPWTDEAIAVGLIERLQGVAPDDIAIRFDLSFGAPPPYRLESLRRALDVLGPDWLQFGSDVFLPCPGSLVRQRVAELEDLLDRLEVAPNARERLWHGTAAAWLRPRPGPDEPNPTRWKEPANLASVRCK